MFMFFGQAATHIDGWFHGTDGEKHIVECAYTIAWSEEKVEGMWRAVDSIVLSVDTITHSTHQQVLI